MHTHKKNIENLAFALRTAFTFSDAGKNSLLVLDMFRGHLHEKCKRMMKEDNITPAVIPGGCTSLLQPLDVCLNKPFKTKMHEFWCKWMISGDEEYIAGGNLKRPS